MYVLRDGGVNPPNKSWEAGASPGMPVRGSWPDSTRWLMTFIETPRMPAHSFFDKNGVTPGSLLMGQPEKAALPSSGSSRSMSRPNKFIKSRIYIIAGVK